MSWCAPSQWACYRFAKMLRTRDQWALDGCIRLVLGELRAQHPGLGDTIAIDGSDLPAYANGQGQTADGDKRKPSDLDASWGHRSAVSTRGRGGFYGYKIHAAVDGNTDLPLAWTVQPANEQEQHFAVPLIDQARKHGFPVNVAVMDKGYDTNMIHLRCEARNVAPVIPLIDRKWEMQWKREEAPHCAHGEWTFAGADYNRKATKWRCPTGECKPASMWIGANRLRPLIRSTKKYRDTYAKRGSIERAFGRLKHDSGLLPLRVRGMAQVQLHADLTILASLATRLAQDRVRAAPLAA